MIDGGVIDSMILPEALVRRAYLIRYELDLVMRRRAWAVFINQRESLVLKRSMVENESILI